MHLLPRSRQLEAEAAGGGEPFAAVQEAWLGGQKQFYRICLNARELDVCCRSLPLDSNISDSEQVRGLSAFQGHCALEPLALQACTATRQTEWTLRGWLAALFKAPLRGINRC
jgi:hypothetical protein